MYIISSKEKVEIVRGELTALFTKIQSQARHPHIEGESPKVFSKTVSRILHQKQRQKDTKQLLGTGTVDYFYLYFNSKTLYIFLNSDAIPLITLH
jgi:hypothetical protein